MRGFSTRFLLYLALAFLSISPLAARADEEQAVKVTDVQIVGNKKVETETIRSKMGLKVGDVFSPSRIRNDISAIYKMGYFDDVQVEAEGYAGGLRLTFTLVERPIITSYSFEGNKEIEAAKLREKVNLTPYSVYNPALVAENAEKLKLFYQNEGYFSATVLPIIKSVSKKEVKVIFQVTEGEKVRISSITFVGNQKISSGKLKKAMATKRYIPVYSYLMSTGTYKLLEFDQDMERIKAVYFNNGYIQVSVGEPQLSLSEDKKRLSITIGIHEGDQFRYGRISFSGNKVFTDDQLQKAMKSKTGEIMDRDRLKADVVAMTDLYGTKGYAFATIAPVINPDVEKKTVDVSLEVNEGDQVFVKRIDVAGNAKTRDKVIRRELKFNEGEIYDTSSLKKSYERLKNLDFFEDVEIVPQRLETKNEVGLTVRVKEKSTGSFSIGGGYSTIDRLVALGEVTQNNFRGLGEQVRFKGEFGKRRQNYVLSFTEPWLFDMPISFRLDLFKEERTYTGYVKQSTGGGVTLGRRFWDYYSATGAYTYTSDKYKDVIPELQETFAQSLNLKSTSKIGLSLSRDTRDNYIDTRRGSSNSLYGEVAGSFLGSDNAYWKAVADSTWFFPFYFDTAFSLHGRVGLSNGMQGKELPLAERFYVGGISTVRGFDFGAVGPKLRVAVPDPISGTVLFVEENQAKGGNKELIFNAEYTFPLLPDIKLRGVAFFDAGNAYDNGVPLDIGSLRYSAGAGVRWTSPLGLIRLEYGRVINRREGEKPGKLEFSMGTMF